jgi:hypothetical protein
MGVKTTEENKVRKNYRKHTYLNLMHDLYINGVDIPSEAYKMLVSEKMIGGKPNGFEVFDKDKEDPELLYKTERSEFNNSADKFIDIVRNIDDIPGSDKNKRHIVLDNQTYDHFLDSSVFLFSGRREIHPYEWKPKDLLDHTPEFVNWINSINRGFQFMIPYKPFLMYVEQSRQWLADKTTIHDFSNYSQQRDYAFSEMQRCQENTLYFMDKYLQLKEGDVSTGNMKYSSKPVHKVLCFMVDCGYSMMIGKPRQIAATSTLGGIALCKAITRKNFFLKMVAQDKDKTVEIFEDKIKYPFTEIPSWLKPEVMNDRDNLFRFAKKTSLKGTKGGLNSKIQVVAPSGSAINGGSPQLVLIDEAGYIPILGRMIKEARPTMFMQDPETKKLKMTRQIIVWGTGGEMDKGGKSFETEFYNNLDLWNEGKYSSGMIPLFFDWTTRPGITKEFYSKEKSVYTIEGPEKEKKAVQFRQAYPSVIEDMFLTSYKLLVGADWINEQVERINASQDNVKIQYGYFEPIFNQSKPMDEHSDVPYAIIGSTFIPCDDNNLEIATVGILFHPKKKWVNRYYQGTDPVMIDNGNSKMASVVYDSYYNTPVAIMNHRTNDHRYTFLQCLLLGLYYGENGEPIKELVESNMGQTYFDYKEAKGYYNSLVQRTELPDYLRGGSQLYGVDNRGGGLTPRNAFIITKMNEVITTYGDRFFFKVIFNQLRTFVCHINDKGVAVWGVTDTRKFDDDVLFGLVFSYICAICYSHKEIKDLSVESSRFKIIHKLIRDKDGNLKRIPQRVDAV